MPPRSNQVTLNFDKLTEANLKPILKRFAKWDCPVASVDAPNKGKRESGFLVKHFTLTFEDGQQMLVRVKADGTVFQVKLNNKVVPIKNVNDMDKAIGEMIDYVQDNAKAYARAKMQRERRRIKPPAPSVKTTRQEKLAQEKSKLEQISQSNAAVENQYGEVLAEIANKQAELATTEKALAQEKEKTQALEAEFAALKGER